MTGTSSDGGKCDVRGDETREGARGPRRHAPRPLEHAMRSVVERKKRSETHVPPASQRRSPCSVWEASRVTAAPRKIRQPQVQEQPSLAHAQTRWRYGHTLRSKLTGCEKKPKYTSLIWPIWQFIDDENFQKATKLEPHVSLKRSQCDFQRPAGQPAGRARR